MKKIILSFFVSALALTISAQNVGIGTNAPASKLDVNGNALVRGTNTNTPSTPVAAVELMTGRASNDAYNSGQTTGDIAIQSGAGGFRHFIASRHTLATYSYNNAIDFYINNSATASGSSTPNTTTGAANGNIEIMSITGVGVGIGTSQPAGMLDVEGGTAVAAIPGAPIQLVAQNGGSGSSGYAGGNITLTAGNAGGTTAANGGNIILTPGTPVSTGTTGYVGIGKAGSSGTTGVLNFYNAANANTVGLSSGTTTTSYTLTFPTAVASAAGMVLGTTNTTGTLGWITPNAGTVTGVTANSGTSLSSSSTAAAPIVQLGATTLSTSASPLLQATYINQNGNALSIGNDAANNALTLGSTSGTSSTSVNCGTGGVTINTSNTTSQAVTVNTNYVTTTTGMGVSANALTSGNAATISSTSTAGLSSNSTYLLKLSRSGANANSSHTAYGISSTVTNAGTTNTNIAGFFSASGAPLNNNQAAIFQADYVGTGNSTVSPNQVVIEGLTSSSKQLMLGYSTDGNYGSIQAIQQGSGFTPLALNPAGGGVGVYNPVPYNRFSVVGSTATGSGTASGNTVTGSGFTFAMTNGTIVFPSTGQSAVITYVGSSTSLSISPSLTVSSSTNYIINYSGLEVTSAGNVGIGTSSPQGNLHVFSTTAGTMSGKNGPLVVENLASGGSSDGSTRGIYLSATGWSGSAIDIAGETFNGHTNIPAAIRFVDNNNGTDIAFRVALTGASHPNPNTGAETEVMRVSSTYGTVGIGGAPTGNAELEINSSSAPNSGSNSYAYYAKTTYGTAGSGMTTYTNYSLYTSGKIWCGGELDVTSDERTKHVLDTSQSARDLESINKLNVVDYKYIDEVAKGATKVKGFLAQQVETVFPDAVNKQTGFIPNIYDNAEDVCYDASTQKLTIYLNASHGLVKGDKVQLKTESGDKTLTVADVTDEKTFVVENWEKNIDKVFVYGKEVNDLRNLDYNKIFSAGISATQELSKQLKDAQDEIKQLRSENAQLKTSDQQHTDVIKTMKAQIDAINDRLNMTTNK